MFIVAQTHVPPLVRTLVVAEVPFNEPPLQFKVPVVLAMVVDAATVFVPVPRLIVPPALVYPALTVPVQAVLEPNVAPAPVTVTTPSFLNVLVAGVNVPLIAQVED
jgi:hypothetical protein